MNNVIGAIRGPVLLITLGVLFAVDQMGLLSFWRTWPALLIVFGLFKLAERGGAGTGASPTGTNQAGANQAGANQA